MVSEIMLLPYYIASLNIEHAYYERTGRYKSFEGICFTDTLELAEEQQLPLFVEKNTERVEHEKAAQIMVVIGNPPYNVGQKNENDNNKNRPYPVIDKHIKETYVKNSKATNRNAISDAYVKFFRWATDRLGERDGIVCLVTNNSFVDQIAFDGMRMQLQKDFTQIYHLDLHGNVRKNPKLSGTTHNVFGIQLGVGITIAIRSSRYSRRSLYYYRVPENWRRTEKLSYLAERRSIAGVDWLDLLPDEKHNWLTEGLQPDFATYLPIGTKEAKLARGVEMGGAEAKTLFKMYSPGAQTSRDDWVYDFNHDALTGKVTRFIDIYNSEIDRWKRTGEPKDIDGSVLYDDTEIKWSRDLKSDLKRRRYAEFNARKVRTALYRPFTIKHYFFDSILSQDIFFLPRFFPIYKFEEENCAICLTNLGAEKPFMVLATSIVPDYHLVGAGAVSLCFPFYTYAEDGSNQRENITGWALAQFQAKYGSEVTKWDIFHYVYAMLHHPQYRERYAENLKRELPHIPLLHSKEAFLACVRIGRQLMDIHLHYEQAKEYPLEWIENREVPFSWRVEKMRLTPDKTAVIVNESLTLSGIPQKCFQYRLGNRSALDWVIDQYQVGEDKRSGIVSDPNNLDDEEYIVRLVGRVITVSVETVKLVEQLAREVTQEDWLGETTDGSVTTSLAESVD
jgi:predicted helicase